MTSSSHPTSPQNGTVQPVPTETLTALFWRVAAQRAPNVAMRWKNLGIWNDILWRDYADSARAVGCALLACGVKRGERVAIVSDTRPEWCYVEFGAMGCGVSTVGVHATASSAELAHVVNDSGARQLFVQDQAQLDKALALLDQMPGIDKILCFDISGLHAFSHPKVLAFERYCEDGRQFHAKNPTRWESEVQIARADDVATVAYTSGREGLPKGAMLTHGNLRFQMQAMERLCPGMEGDDQLSILSMSHIGERYFSAYRSLDHGAVVHMGKGLSTLLADLREVSPHVVSAVPRVWEKLRATVNASSADGTPLERGAFVKALSVGFRVVACRLADQPVPGMLSAAYALARMFVLNRVLSMIGLRRTRLMVSSAAPVPADTMRWFQALGLHMVQVYGQTESVGHAARRDVGQHAGTLARHAMPDAQIRIAADGEILVKGPHVFAGYLNQPQRTEQALVDGWLRTGDKGSMDAAGHLATAERLDDIIETSSGARIAPAHIEAKLTTSPLIADAMVVGHGLPSLACLVWISHENVAKCAREMQLSFTNFANLTRLPEIRHLVQQEVDRVNHGVAQNECITCFALVDTELSVLDPDMTPLLQLRRKGLTRRYLSVIESMYANVSNHSPITTTTLKGDLP